MLSMNPSLLGLVRGLGIAVLMAVLTYLGDAAHLSGVLSIGAAGIVSALAMSFEHYIAENSGKALFGAVAVR